MSYNKWDFAVLLVGIFLISLVVLSEQPPEIKPPINLYLDMKIEGNTTELVHKIRALKRTDIVRLYVFTPGGQALEALELMHALASTPSNITLVIDSFAASAGGILLCSWTHKLALHDEAVLAFHTLQQLTPAGQIPLKAADVGKTDMFTQLVYYIIKNKMERNCRKAFTDQEWADMWDNGKDIAMSGKTYKQRMGIK